MSKTKSRVGAPKIPTIIDHKNMGPLLKAISAEPYFQCGSGVTRRPDWAYMPVVLEVPTGELAEDGLKTLAIVGFSGMVSGPVSGQLSGFASMGDYETCSLSGKEGFVAQGLEGKVRIRKPLFGALMNLRDLIKPGRGRIVTVAKGGGQ